MVVALWDLHVASLAEIGASEGSRRGIAQPSGFAIQRLISFIPRFSE
jgi:hypothetical protein